MGKRLELGRAWIDQHWRSVAFGVAGVLIGGVAGWWAGSATACASEGCEANAAAIKALGTWVGGLGTVAAVAFAVVAFRSEEASRREMELRLHSTEEENEKRARNEASQVRVHILIGSTDGTGITEVRVRVSNGTNTTTAYKVEGKHQEFGRLAMVHRIDAGKSHV